MKYDKQRYIQIRKVAKETIKQMGNHSHKAVNACMMVIAHESLKGTLREQVISFNADNDELYKLNNDYARGIGGCEKATHDDLWVNSDNIREDYLKVFGHHYNSNYCNADRLVYDDKYAIFMIRKKLHMIIEPIPEDLGQMARYLVKYYNAGGKADHTEYLNDFINWSK